MKIVPPPGFRWVGRLIKKDFRPLGKKNVHMAMCVAKRESNFDPDAYNRNSGASGVFQFIPSSWEYYSEKAGYGGKSPFNARANVGTAAWTVKHVGWGPWGGHCP
jgi:soluble lytic murein transglycosylase-like protein